MTSTLTPCPTWCTVNHDDGTPPGAGFHAGPSLPLGLGRLWQADQPDAPAGVVIGGQQFSEAQAHEIGLALVRAGDALRREAGMVTA